MAIIKLAVIEIFVGEKCKKCDIDRPAPDPLKVNVQLIFISY